jgi:hypothetical protein
MGFFNLAAEATFLSFDFISETYLRYLSTSAKMGLMLELS